MSPSVMNTIICHFKGFDMTAKETYINDYRAFSSVLRLFAIANNLDPALYLDQLDKVCRSAIAFAKSGEK